MAFYSCMLGFIVLSTLIRSQSCQLTAELDCTASLLCQEEMHFCVQGNTHKGVCRCWNQLVQCLSYVDSGCYSKDLVRQNCEDYGCQTIDCELPPIIEDYDSPKKSLSPGEIVVIVLLLLSSLLFCICLFRIVKRDKRLFQ